jgi:exodeoxyribonuclease-5
MKLTEEQKSLIRGVMAEIKTQQVVTVGGYAGTGKSTIIKVLLEAFRHKNLSFAVCAYTGKAANVLRKKGLESAQTIHSAIYKPTTDENENTVWVRASIYDQNIQSIDGFIVDEASMVSKEIHDDLLYFDRPIIYVGDHGQLEPIGSKFNLMSDPMFRLETVHRNAGEIAHFAEHLRKGKSPSKFDGRTKVQICSESAVDDRHLASVDQIIVAFNKTRVGINERVRTEKKINASYVSIGDKVICLRNKRKEGLFNGMQGLVTFVRKNEKFDFISDGVLYQKVKYDMDQFGKEKNEFDFASEKNPFDYAYAITCHKAQGDQFGNVIVYEQECDKWDHVRWSYTAASRAVNGLIWLKREEYLPYYLD